MDERERILDGGEEVERVGRLFGWSGRFLVFVVEAK